MLGKVFKYECSYMFKRVGIIYIVGVFAVIFAIITASIAGRNLENSWGIILGIISPLALLFTFLGVFASTVGLVIARFYKSMFSNEGYLTFTLPVRPTDHLMSKWMIGTLILILDYIFIVIGFETVFSIGVGESIIGTVMTMIEEIKFSNIELVAMVLYPVIIAFDFIGIFFLSICLGQRFKRKIEGSVLCYIAIYVIQQTIGLLLIGGLLLTGNFEAQSQAGVQVHVGSSGEVTTTYDMIYGPDSALLMWVLLAIILVQSVVYIVICRYIVNKKVNLE